MKKEDVKSFGIVFTRWGVKINMPYVFHPFHVAEHMKDEVTTIVALLYDVVEEE